MRDRIRQLAAHAGGVDAGDNAVFDMLNQAFVTGHQRAGGQRQIFKAQSRQDFHHVVDHPIAFAKRMVERNGHAVFQATAGNGVFQGGA